jgi:parallel beta-helix repeat protein
MTTYYVAPNGNDSNPGTAQGSPLQTINKALDKAQNSGDIIYVMTGIYQEAMSISQNGITLSAYQGNNPVIDGGNNLPSGEWGSLIAVDGDNNTISGFEVRKSNGQPRGGYGVEINGKGNKLSKMNVHHSNEQGIYIHGDHNIVEDSLIWQNSKGYEGTSDSSGWATGISAARNNSSDAIKQGITSYAILRRNTVYNNFGEGISCFEADHCTMEDNVVYDNWTMNMYISDTPNTLVQRNLVYISSSPAISFRDSSKPGIVLADELPEKPRSANNTIVNNLIYNANLNAFTWSLVSGSGLDNVSIANNMIVDGNLNTGDGDITNRNSTIEDNVITGKNSNIPSSSGITFARNYWGSTPSAAKSNSDVTTAPNILHHLIHRQRLTQHQRPSRSQRQNQNQRLQIQVTNMAITGNKQS